MALGWAGAYGFCVCGAYALFIFFTAALEECGVASRDGTYGLALLGVLNPAAPAACGGGAYGLDTLLPGPAAPAACGGGAYGFTGVGTLPIGGNCGDAAAAGVVTSCGAYGFGIFGTGGSAASGVGRPAWDAFLEPLPIGGGMEAVEAMREIGGGGMLPPAICGLPLTDPGTTPTLTGATETALARPCFFSTLRGRSFQPSLAFLLRCGVWPEAMPMPV